MYNVYCDNIIIRFATAAEPCGESGEVVRIDLHDRIVPNDGNLTAKVLEKLGNNKNVCVKCDDPLSVFMDFCNGMAQVKAAGGLVRNSGGDSLMIFRDGRWDLPKGHLDPYEDCAECALREVKEECGLVNLTLGGFICQTYHIYNRRGQWIIKETHWYTMSSDDTELVPQTEEGIEKAEWVSPTDVPERLAKSYPTIAHVFSAAAGNL